MNGKQIIALVLGTTLSGCTPQAPLSTLPAKERLKALAEREGTTCGSPVSAMCYAVMAPPSRQEYLCPSCRRKTVYMTEDVFKKNSSQNRLLNGSWTHLAEDIERMRDKMKKLAPLAKENGYELQLDESGFCAQCGKNEKMGFALIAVDASGRKTRTDAFDDDDCVYLKAFFNGDDYYVESDGKPEIETGYGLFGKRKEVVNGIPLKKQTQRIAQLLGLKLEEGGKND